MLYRCTQLAVVLLALCGAGIATADTLNMPGAETSRSDQPRSMVFLKLPVKGMTMDQVGAQFGQPLEKTAPVGKPPITRWIYRNYTVYFEYTYVVHAVLN